MRKRFGIITPTISPFENGRIDGKAIDALIKFMKKTGVKGIFPCGSTGCAQLMDKDRHIAVINAYAESNNGSMKMFPGIGRNSVVETVQVARAAMRANADALVLVTPYYMPLSQKSIFSYFDRMLSMIDFDIIAYNIPQFTGNMMEISTFEKLRKRHRNLVGIKDSSKKMDNFRKMCKMLPDDIMIFQGQDDLLLKSMEYGASGGVCGTTNFNKKAVEVFDAFADGQRKKAEKLQKELAMAMPAFNSFEFPTAYHYAFYRKIMHKDRINALQPFYANDAERIKPMKAKLKKFI